MSYQGVDAIRIAAEYERRAREIPSDYYSWAKPANLLMHQQTARGCIEALHAAGLFPLGGRRVLDIGCGAGAWLLEFMQWGAEAADLAGIDLVPGRVEHACRRLPRVDLRIGNASELPWPDESFDVVSQLVVFTSIFDYALKRAVAGEMLRVLKPDGGILWFDMRVTGPAAKAVGRSEIESLFPGCEVRLKPAVLAPPVSRMLAGRSWAVSEALHALPWLRTHYVGIVRKNKRAERPSGESRSA